MLTHYETERLILRVCSPRYSQEVLRFYYANRNIFQPYDPIYPDTYYTVNYQYTTLTYEYNSFLENKGVRFYLFPKRQPQYIIGTISFFNIIQGYVNSAVIGYKLDQNYQHYGLAYEAMQKGIELMFYDLRLHKLYAYIMPDNLPSIKLIQRLYFTHEGTSRDYALINGRWADHEQYSLINPLQL